MTRQASAVSHQTPSRRASATVVVGLLTAVAISNVGFTIGLGFALPMLIVMMLAVLHFGLLTFIVMNYVGPLIDHVSMTFDPGLWYATQSWLVLAVVVGLAVFAYRAAVAGRPALSLLAALY